MGDPAGIGPEIVAKVISDRTLLQKAHIVVYGANDVLTLAADHCGVTPNWFRVDANSERATQHLQANAIVLDDGDDGLHSLSHSASALGGHVSKRWVERAIKDAMLPTSDPRKIDAVVTAPICKESWSMGGYSWPGHTELFASRTKAKRHAMMFVSDSLRVVLATCHIPLMDIRNVLTIGKVFDAIDLAHGGCTQLGIEKPRIAVTGLNPHAGENGVLGDEESRLISPAIKHAQNQGMHAEGPFPADTIFTRANDFDVIVAMYHDQGLLPVKLLSFGTAVNWTVGIPIIRTSPDHGTAFDIAGANAANPKSLLHAIELASTLTTTNPLIKSTT
jgi:4-phospho-D-threonate 3-dehydrogenase / 4-phospho-D-erythronate 3-dehydrogenase